MAVLALGALGAGLSSAVGIGASIGWMGGVMLGNMLFGDKGANVEGSRVSDLSVQTSTYGGMIQLVYGTMRTSGNIIWSTPLKETRHVQSMGGKGGMMGGGGKSTSYTYSVSFAIGLCAGPVATVRRIWADTKLVYDATASNSEAMEKQPGVIRIYCGTEEQQPDSTIEMHLGVGNVPAYRGMCYLVFTDFELADFANRIPNISAEVVSAGDMECDAVLLPEVPSMLREGGLINPANGTLIGFSLDTIYKYDLVRGKLLLNSPLGEDDVYGSLRGIDSNGYFYHATDARAVSMHLCKRHPETLAVVAKTTERVPVSVTGFVLGDKIYAPRARKVYRLDFKEIADLSEFFPYANEAPMCADGEGRYWQAAADKIRRVEVDILGNGDLDEWDVAAWTSGQTPEIIFWDDTTGHLYFKLNSLKRIVKWHPNDGYVGHVDEVAISAGYSMQGD